MLSGKLIRLIETHEEEITERIVWSIRHHPEMPHLGDLPELELRERCQEILRNLGHWLASRNEEKLAAEYDAIGRTRFQASIPLEECVRGLWLIKEKTVAFLDSQGLEPDYLGLYAEEQLMRRLGPFFDLLVLHLVRGYEKARLRTVHAA